MKCISIEERAVNLAHYIIDSKDTVRGAAKKFGISKSTVHKDVTERLEKINPALTREVRKILNENKAERHIRGGMATKLKYLKKFSRKEKMLVELLAGTKVKWHLENVSQLGLNL